MTDDDLMTVEEVAELLHAKPYTVRAWANAKTLRGLKPGKRWFFRRGDVDAFLEASQNRPRETEARRRRRRAA